MRAKMFVCFVFVLQILTVSLCSLSFAEEITQEIYRLDTGDKVKITVFGEDDLSGEIEVDGSGSLSLPLVGEVKAQGLSLREMEKQIAEIYNPAHKR